MWNISTEELIFAIGLFYISCDLFDIISFMDIPFAVFLPYVLATLVWLITRVVLLVVLYGTKDALAKQEEALSVDQTESTQPTEQV